MALLSFFNFSPLIGAFCLLFLINFQKSSTVFISKFTLWWSNFCWAFSLYLWVIFDQNLVDFQFIETYNWFFLNNFTFTFGLDGISIIFIILTAFLTPLCLLSTWKVIDNQKVLFSFSFLLLESLVFLSFSSLDLFLFFIFFESVLIPMFFIIGFWGSRQRKIRASFMFFLFTLFGSITMFISLFIIYYQTGSTDFRIISITEYTVFQERIFWLAFFLAFAVKVPMLPIHLWLPEAHVEAPTAGSVILAGVLLKLGSYGFVRFSLGLFPQASLYFTPFISTIALLGILYASITAVRQTDVKRIIAYASVAHMNVIILGIFCNTVQGLEGALFQMLSHGIVSSGLFLSVGVIYDRHHSRAVQYYSGLSRVMPLFTSFFLLFTMANIALPGTSSFIGEFLILVGVFYSNSFICFFAAISMVLGGVYSLWLFNRMFFGNLKNQYLILSASKDLSLLEFSFFAPLAFFVFSMGLFSSFYTDVFHICCHFILC